MACRIFKHQTLRAKTPIEDRYKAHVRPMRGPGQKYSATRLWCSWILIEIKEKYSRNVAVTVEEETTENICFDADNSLYCDPREQHV